MKLLILFLTLTLTSVPAFAETEDLIISIEKTFPAAMIQKAVNDLLVVDATFGHCYFQAGLEMYSDYSKGKNEPYYGVATIRLQHNCAAARRKSYLKKVMTDKRFKIWGNPSVEGMPSVSGGNQI